MNTPRSRFGEAEFQAICASIGYEFKDRDLIKAALTHGSSKTGTLKTSYQRLEFLGDRVLGLVIAEELYRRHPRRAEGQLAPNFSLLVRAETCAEAASELGIGEHIRLGVRERLQGVAKNVFILGDVMEAILGAIYLDGGLEPARVLILRLWEKRLASRSTSVKDAKSFLQEWALGQAKNIPAYRIIAREGPDHSPSFTIGVAVDGYEEATAQGQSKRAAEQLAAQAFLKREKIRK
ncbi:MAG: ribonuclease III [Parvibaculaceae bacterium]